MSSAPHELPELPCAPNRKRLSRRAKRDLAVAFAGIAYILLTLALSLNAPLISILFVALAAHELIAGRGT